MAASYGNTGNDCICGASDRFGKMTRWVIASMAYAPILLFLFVEAAFASEGGGHGESGAGLTDLLYRFINFALLVIILVFVVRKTSIKDFFSARRAEIAQKFETLKNEKSEAESRYQALDKKLREFEDQRKTIIAQYRAEGEAEKQKIIADARDRAGQIVAQAELSIQRELQGVKDRLKAEIMIAAAQKAEEIISHEFKDKDQDRLVSEFIERVEKLH